MLLIIFSFMCFVVTVIGAFRVYKSVRANDTENTNKWLIVTLSFMFLSWIVRWANSIFDQTFEDKSESKRKYYFLNEDYVFLDGITPKAYFKKGDLISGFVIKYGEDQIEYLFTGVAKIVIPTKKLRYPNETELKEIEGEIKKLMDNLGK